MKKRLNKAQKISVLLLLGAKALERLAFYLIMAILLHYLTDCLKIAMNKAAVYYSAFYGITGTMILFSGLLGDLLNRAKVVIGGFIILSLMYLAMAFLPDINWSFIVSLVLLGTGIGLISPNLIVFLGNIYNEKDNEVIGLSGFILFSIATNIGAFIAPSLSILLKNNWGYGAVFFFAFIAALLAFILFLRFKVSYNQLDLIAEKKNYLAKAKTKHLNTIILVSILFISILIKWVSNQKGASFIVAAHDYLENGIEMTKTLNNIEIHFIILALLIFIVIITQIKSMNWGKVFNLIIMGLVLSIIAFILVASFTPLSQLTNGENIFVSSYALLVLAEAIISPALFYIVYRSSPLRYKGLFQGIFHAVLAISNSLVFLGILLYKEDASMAFSIFATLLSISTILVIVLKVYVTNKLNKAKLDN